MLRKDLKSFNFTRLFFFSSKIKFLSLIIIILLIHQIIFQKLLIFNNHLVAEDFHFYIPNLVFGKIWYLKNGLFVIPDFAAHQCGIIPFHADPNSSYYSLAQILFFFFNISNSLKIFFFLLSLAAFLGTYFLAKLCFKMSKYSALLCSTIFLFAGNNVYPMLVGHMNLAHFMLVPLYCFLIIHSARSNNLYLSRIYILVSSLLFAHFFYAGTASIMLFIIYTSFLVILIFYIINNNFRIFNNFFISLFIGSSIAISKITYGLYLLSNFPRKLDSTILNNFFDFLYTFATSFFLVPNPFYYESNQYNLKKTYISLHGLEFGLSIVPLIIFFIFIYNFKKFMNKKNILTKVFLLILLVFPIFFIFQVAYISDFFNSLPILSAIWERVRFFYIYTIPIILFTGLILERIDFLKKNKKLTIILIFLPIIQTLCYHYVRNYFFPQKSFESKAIYSIHNVNNFSNNLSKNNIDSVKIEKIDYLIDQNRLDKNEGFINSTCKFFCYSTTFGYHSEKIPIKIFSRSKDHHDNIRIIDDKYNVFDPVCFLFPKENSCEIGDRLKKTEKDKLDNLTNYKPINFNKPTLQKITNLISLLTFLLSIIFIFSYLIKYLKNKKFKL
jgi:hypothetical protein